MPLAFASYVRVNDAAQYTSGNVADIRDYIESVCGIGSTSMFGTVIINPNQAVFLGDWILPGTGTFDVRSNAVFTGGYKLA
jgi:hypothetical protein